MNDFSAGSYDNALRFDVYKTQVSLLEGYDFNNVLEFGVGSGFMKRYLTSKGKQVYSVDVNESLNPDFNCRIEDFKTLISYDVTTCFQVLEYVNEKDLLRVLDMLVNSGKVVFISVPLKSWFLKASLKLPFCGFGFEKVWFFEKGGKCAKYRCWELGDEDHSVKWFLELLSSNYISVLDHGCFFPDALHYYFIIQKGV